MPEFLKAEEDNVVFDSLYYNEHVMDGEKILTALDNLVKLSSDTALEFGWLANDYFNVEKDSLVAEFGTEEAAQHETISFIHDREAAFIVARSTVADRMRVTRYVTREMYDDIVAESHCHPSFHQLRNCMVTYNGEILTAPTKKIIDWCMENEWPTVQEIRDYKNGVDPIPDYQRKWEQLTRCASAFLRMEMPAEYEEKRRRAHVVLGADENAET